MKKRYSLQLVALEDGQERTGEVLDAWTVGEDDDDDYSYPISRVAAPTLAEDINREIATYEAHNE